MKCLCSGRQYDSAIPVWLRNRPATFVRHCMERLPFSATLTPDQLIELPEGLYHIFNPTSAKHHAVRISSNDACSVPAPNCSCVDWHKTSYPCKHMLAVMAMSGNVTWEDFPLPYRQCLLFNLDLPPEQVSVNCANGTSITENVNAAVLVDVEPDSDSDRLTNSASQEVDKTFVNDYEPSTECNKLQIKLRERLRHLSNLSFTISLVDVLKTLTTAVGDLIRTAEASVPKSSFGRFRLRQTRRVTRRNTYKSFLSRRLRSIRTKSRNKKKQRLQAASSDGMFFIIIIIIFFYISILHTKITVCATGPFSGNVSHVRYYCTLVESAFMT